MDATLRKVNELSHMLKETVTRIHELGSDFLSYAQLQALGSRALLGSVMGTPFQIEHVPPGDRHNFSVLVNGFAAIERTIATLLNRDAAYAPLNYAFPSFTIVAERPFQRRT